MNIVNPHLLPQLVRLLTITLPVELGCEECCEEMSAYAERFRAGRGNLLPPPAVRQHLERCADCSEEFEALVGILGEMKE